MDDSVLEKLAAASSVEEVKACLKDKGLKLVADASAEPPPEGAAETEGEPTDSYESPKSDRQGKAPPFGKVSLKDEIDVAMRKADKEVGGGRFFGKR